MTRDEKIALGRTAETELEALETAFSQLRAETFEQIASTAIEDGLLREKLCLSVIVLDRVRDIMGHYVSTGKYEMRILQEEVTPDA